MAFDGTLTQKQVLTGTLTPKQVLTGSLRHIPEEDKTLTKEGCYAEAAAVGEALADKAPLSHAEDKENPHGVTAEQLGLGNVDNTTDLDKPVSKAQAQAIAAHANNKKNPHGVTAEQLGVAPAEDSVLRSPHQFMHEYNSALKNEIVECALSYYRNADKLYYGSESIATSLDEDRQNPLGYYSDDIFIWTALERKDGKNCYIFTDDEYNNEFPEVNKMFTCHKADVETYMEQARANADNIACQIDCSSFAHLVMSGVPFSHSRYAKWMNTDGDTDNVPFYEWGYVWDKDEIAKYYTNRKRLGAANMGQYCFDHGFGVEVTDWKRFQTGDLLFQTDPDKEGTAFRKVGHVMIYLCPCTVGASNEVDHWVIDVGKTNESASKTAPVSIKRVGLNQLSGAYSNVTYAGRLPITLNRDTQPRNLVKSTSATLPCTLEDVSVLQPLKAYLENPLKKDALYTVVMDIDLGDSFTEDNIDPEVGLYYNTGYVAARKQVKTNRSGSLYSFTLIQGQVDYPDDTTFFTLLTRHNGSQPAYHKKTVIRGVSVYEGIYPNGGLVQTEGTMVSTEARLAAAEKSITNADGRITSAEGRITSAEGRITTVEGTLGSLNGTLSNFDGRIVAANKAIASKMSMSLLWQNSSLSEYAGQSFSLSQVAKMYLVVAKAATGTNARVSAVATAGVQTRLNTVFSFAPCYRDITINNGTGTVTVADCNKIIELGAKMTVDNKILIPEAIYGINWNDE